MKCRAAPTRCVRAALVSGATIALVAVTTPPARAQFAASVSVDAGAVRAVMSPLGLGVHTSPYYNNLSHASVDDRLEESGVTTLRYGGGGYADVLHWSIARPQWESGVEGGGLSPWWGEEGDFGYVGPGSDFGSFVRLLDRTEGSRAVVTVNYGSALKLENGQSVVPDYGGQPQEAAAWVAYANADPAIYATPDDITLGVDQQGNNWKTAGYWARLRASTGAEYQSWAASDGVYEPLNQFLAIDRDEPVGVQHWEIGNETFGTGYYGGGDGYSVDYDLPYGQANRALHGALSPARYGQDLAEYAQLMRAVDPSIKIGAVLATPPDDYDWSYADFDGDGRKDDDEPYWNDEVLANAGGEVDFAVVHWYPWAGENANGASLLAQVGEKLPRMINGATPGLDTGDQAGLRDTLAAHGIPDAEIMVTEFNYFGSLQSSTADETESIFVADAYASWLGLGVSSVQYLELLTKDFLSDTGGLSRGSAFYGVSMVDRLANPGDALVAADSSQPDLRAHAAVQADGSVAVMLLNLDPASAAEVAVDVAGAQLADEGLLYTLTDGVALSETAVSGLSSGFTAAVAPRSIALYVIPTLDTMPGDFNADGVVNISDYVAWRDGLGAGMAAELYDEWLTNYGQTTGSVVPLSAAPEPAAAILLAGAAAISGLGRRRAARRRGPSYQLERAHRGSSCQLERPRSPGLRSLWSLQPRPPHRNPRPRQSTSQPRTPPGPAPKCASASGRPRRTSRPRAGPPANRASPRAARSTTDRRGAPRANGPRPASRARPRCPP